MANTGYIKFDNKDIVTVIQEETADKLTQTQADELYLGKLAKAESAKSADQDASGNVITTTYATKTEVTQGLVGKAPSIHTHTKSQITDFPEISDTSTLIPKNGNRGTLSGFETYTQDGSLLINKQAQDSNLITSTQLTIEGPSTGECYTKVVHWNCGPESTVTLPQHGFWSGGSAQRLKQD